ncbi:MAG: glycosyltransferase family 4 protein [Candidatus Velthaea sp.]
MIHAGVDAWNLPGDQRGIGRYVRALLHEWQSDFPDRIRISLIVPERHPLFAAPRYRRAAGGNRWRVRSRAGTARAGFDMLWFPFNGPSWEPRFRGPAVATLHDASTFVLPGFSDDARAPFLAAARACAHIVTVSIFSANELTRVLALPRDRISAVPLGVAAPRTPVRPRIDPVQFGRFVLYVGGTEPRKDLATVFAAMRRLTERDATLRFVQIGPQTFALPPHDGVRVTQLGVVDDDTLAAFYRACAAFVYASVYEGFGLPILEAMNYGAPVVAAAASSLREAGGDAALYAPPGDAGAFTEALARILKDRAIAAELGERGRRRAGALSWRRTAEATLRIFERVVAEAT